jgi:hypothetical protein
VGVGQEFEIDRDGKAVERRTPHSRRKAAARKPTQVASSLWRRIYNRYKAGFVGGLLLLDALALGVFLVDVTRFIVLRDRSLRAAGRVAGDAVSQGEVVASVVSVLVFFLIAVPFIASLLPKFLAPSTTKRGRIRPKVRRRATRRSGDSAGPVPSHPRWRWLLLARGRPVVMGHVSMALVIPLLTVLAYTMQVLCGFQNRGGANSFESYWMMVVGRINWLSSAIFVPTLLKYALRLFGHEGPHFWDVFKEVGSEDLYH